jgi:hypothetical protein
MLQESASQFKRWVTPREISFDPESGYLVARLEKEAFELEENRVYFEGRPFEPKDEVHITILSGEAAETVRQHLEDHPQQEEHVRQLIEQANWETRIMDSFYHVREEPDAETIIQMVEIPELGWFFKRLSELVGRELERPPTHVTLYLRNTEKGIGIPTRAELERLDQRQVQLSDLKGEADA